MHQNPSVRANIEAFLQQPAPFVILLLWKAHWQSRIGNKKQILPAAHDRVYSRSLALGTPWLWTFFHGSIFKISDVSL